jgi:hypothetical protein
MAEANAIRAYLRNVIGMGNDALGTERATAVMAEGLDDMQSFLNFEKEDIKALCSTIRKPGGTIPDPQDQARNIPNPGLSLPAICESRMILASYGAKIYQQMGREISSASLNISRLKSFREHKEVIANHNDPENFPSLGKSFNIMKMLEQFPTYLEEKIGVTGIPLAYVIREDDEVPDPLPNFANGRVPYSEDSLMDDLIAYSKHEGPSYKSDNAKVYVLLQEIVGDSSHVSSIKQFQRQRNGREAFKALTLHNMGNSKWDKVVEDAETMVNNRRWDGRNSRYPLKAHINKHREANNDFVRASQTITYVPPDEHTKVRRLLNSIQCKDATIVSAKTTILADNVKKNDFELAADFLMLMAPAPTPNVREQRIMAYSTSTSEGGGNRYYTKDEWRNLSSDERQSIIKKRKGVRFGAGTGKTAKRNKSFKAKIAALQQQVNEQTQTIASMSSSEKVSLPPTPKVTMALKPALKPPSGFTQRG